MPHRSLFVFFACLVCPLGPALAGEPAGLSFKVTFDPTVRETPFSGRVLIFLSDDKLGQPRKKFGWLTRQPLFAAAVRDWKPGETLTLRKPMGYPFDLKDLPPGKYRIQAVMHTNPDVPHSGTAPGNLYSKTVRRELDPAAGGVVELRIDRRVKPRKQEMYFERGRLVEFRSPMLSRFHGRDVVMRAVVVLPEEYETQPGRRFPAIYVIPGFGGDHFQAAGYAMMLGRSEVPFVRIGLDPTTRWGHHVFADSDNNGPCGTALVTELIPHLEKQFRLIAEPRARFLTGHSSGGWSSLWLQVTYPSVFGGTWSTSPDPVDFHDFCGINLYETSGNAFVDADGRPRPIMRSGGEVILYLKDFMRREDTLGPGGQINSFEAVFGPRGADAAPKPLFDRKTGKADPAVVRAWRRYDIRDKIERRWSALGPKLAGKITIIIGGEDNFYLEGAVRRLKDSLKRLGSDARVIIVPGKDHGSIVFTKHFRSMIDEMGEKFLAPSRSATRPAA